MKPTMSGLIPDLAPELSAGPTDCSGDGTLDEHVTTLINEVTSNRQSRATERRREHRIRCNVPALLVALSDDGQALDLAPWKITIRDLSRSGVGIAHVEPLPYRLVLLTIDTAASEPMRLMARLNWCRFKRSDYYESGGQILRTFKPGE